jgi:uncharacterized repeat protein (TIGR03803 family)
LATFTGANGANPFAGLVADASGNFYGTTAFGGASGDGTVFKVAAGTHALTTLATFDGTNGYRPDAALVADASGNLYGTTSGGGDGGNGTVFEVVAGTNALVTLAAFDGTNGSDPEGNLFIDASGNIYGTTVTGGANGAGSVFELMPVPEPSSLLLAGLAALAACTLRSPRCNSPRIDSSLRSSA